MPMFSTFCVPCGESCLFVYYVLCHVLVSAVATVCVPIWACAKTWTGLWTMDCGLWTVDCGLWTMDCGLWTVS